MVWDKAFALAKNYGKKYLKDKITKEKAEEFAFSRIVKAGKHLSRSRDKGTDESLRPGFQKRRPTVEIDDPSMADEYYG